MRRELVTAALIALVAALAAGPALAVEEHHGEAGPEAAAPEAAPQEAPGGPGMGMMGPGMGMGMMGPGMGMGMMGGRGMMGHGMGGMMGHGGTPSVVINIYPGGGMGMMAGPGMMGPGMGMMGGQGTMAGQGMMMMGPGGGAMMGRGMMGPGMGMGGMPGDLAAGGANLSPDDVRARLESWLGEDSAVSVGDVVAIDDDLISAQLVDAEGKPVRRMVVARHTGAVMAVR